MIEQLQNTQIDAIAAQTPILTTDSIGGKWTGTVNYNPGNLQIEAVISIQKGCGIGEICGSTRGHLELYCEGNLFLDKVEGETFVFIERNMRGTGDCHDGNQVFLRLLSTGNLSWVLSGTGLEEDGNGILKRS